MTALLWIFGILLFLFLLTWFPVHLEIGFHQEFSLTLRYLFLRFPLAPGKKQPEEEKEEEQEEKPKKGDQLKEILSRTGFSGFLQSLFELVRLAASSGRKLVSRCRWERFDLYLCIGGKEDAAAAAQLYGQLSAAVYSACAFLFTLTHCRSKGVTVDLNYDSAENTADFSGKLSLRPAYLLKEAVYLLIKGFPAFRNLLGLGKPRKKTERRANGNERQESQ